MTSLDLVEVPVLDFAFVDFMRLAPLISLLWLLIFILVRNYRGIERRLGTSELYAVLQSTALGALALMLSAFFFGRYLFSRLIIIYAWAISIFLVWGGRFFLHLLQRYFWGRGIGTKKVLVCGAGEILSLIHISEPTRPY